MLRWVSGVVIGVLLLVFSAWQLARSRSVQVFGEHVARVETEQPVVALTFDDGPTPRALATLLPLLRDHGVHATFFVTGAALERNPELGAALIKEGHELGNHSYSHQRMLMKSQAFIAEEIERTDVLIRAAGHKGPVYFRPPYGLKLFALPYYLQKTGRTTVLWDVAPDSGPSRADRPMAIAANVGAHARPGSIILLHVMFDSRQASLAAVPLILEDLHTRGFRFVTLSELLEKR